MRKLPSDLKNLSMVAGSNMLNSIFGFASGILIARMLGTEAFGSLAIFVAFMGVYLQIAGQGIDWATVRFAAKHLDENPKKSAVYFKVMLKIRVVLGLIVLIAGNLLANILVDDIFGKPEYLPLVRFATIAAVGSSFCLFLLSYYQTTQQFFRFGFVNLFGNGVKIIPVALLIAAGMLTLSTTLAVYSVVGFIGVILGLYWMPKGYFQAHGEEKEVRVDLFNLGKWLFIATILDTIYRKLDVFMIGYFGNTTNVGIYSAALNIIFAMDLLVLSCFTVLMPRVSKIRTKSECKEYIEDTLKLSFLIAVPLLGVLWLAEPIIVFFYSSKFLESVRIFNILFAGFLFSLILQPISLLFFAKDRPDLFVYTNLLLIAVVSLGHICWIPKSGIVGAAYVTIVGRGVQGMIIILFTYLLVFHSSSKFRSAESCK